jgi:multiple sugar transport system permease protein
MLLLVLFTYYPAANLLINSFTSWNGVSQKLFIGIKNYKEIFSGPSYFKIFSHNLAYFIVGLVQIAVAMYFAVTLNTKLRAKNFFKVTLFLPYILNSIAVAFILNFVLVNQDGALNTILRNIGWGSLAHNWLGDPQIVNFTMGLMALWKYMGFMMVIFIGALQSIPGDVYEAAAVDGANSFHAFRYITLPAIWGIFELAMFMNLNGVLSAFEFPFAIYPLGSPMEMCDTFVTKTLSTAFTYNRFGMASALGVVLMLLTGALVLVQKRILFRKED